MSIEISKILKKNDFLKMFFIVLSVLFLNLIFLIQNEGTALAGSATLTWSAPTTNVDGTPLTDLSGYKIYYGTTSGVYGTSLNVGLNVGTPPTYTVNNLGVGTYYFTVSAYDATGLESNFSNERSKIFAGPVISAVAANNISVSGATIVWNTDITATSQVEFGQTTAYGSLAALDSSLVNGHSQSLTSLQGGTLYHFRVKSADGSGLLSVSGDNSFTTVANPGPAISSISATNISISGATIFWTTDVAANSQAEYGTTTAYGTLTALNSVLSTGHSQSLTALLGGTTYHYRVRSADGSGTLSVSGDNIFTTTNNPPIISGITSGNVAAFSASISWTTNVATNTQVEYGTTTAYGASSTLNSALVTSHSQTLGGLQPSTTYHFRVRSADGTGQMTLSGDNLFATTSDPGPVISGISATNISNSGATITWTTNLASTSQMEFGTTTAYGFSTTLNTTLLTTHSQVLTGLQPGTLYHFRVESADSLGSISLSIDNIFTTGGSTRPSAPRLHSRRN